MANPTSPSTPTTLILFFHQHIFSTNNYLNGVKCKYMVGAVKTLVKISERVVDVSLTPKAECRRAVSILLPYLLHKGITNDAVECRAIRYRYTLAFVLTSSVVSTPNICSMFLFPIESELKRLLPRDFCHAWIEYAHITAPGDNTYQWVNWVY